MSRCKLRDGSPLVIAVIMAQINSQNDGRGPGTIETDPMSRWSRERANQKGEGATINRNEAEAGEPSVTSGKSRNRKGRKRK